MNAAGIQVFLHIDASVWGLCKKKFTIFLEPGYPPVGDLSQKVTGNVCNFASLEAYDYVQNKN